MAEPQKLHPLLMTAAGAVIVACGVAVAHMAGWIGGSKTAEEVAASTPAAAVAMVPAPASMPAVASVPAQVAVIEPTPAAKPTGKSKTHHNNAGQRATGNQGQEYASSQVATQQEAPKPVCAVCGRVTSVQAVTQEGKASGGGAVAGGVLGGVLGHQVGNGNGRTVATVVGALGGALAGNTVEKKVRTTTAYDVHVQFDDGSTRTYAYKDKPEFAAGDRVRASGEALVLDR